MTDKDPLDAYFAAAEGTRPVPSDDLMARVMADADAVARARETTPAPVPGPGLGVLFGLIGGWRGAMGLGAAAMAGLVIGIVEPESLPVLGETLVAEADNWDGMGFGFGAGTGFEGLLEEDG